jgi:predicted Fe-Mo cluster-binding NifX family protein
MKVCFPVVKTEGIESIVYGHFGSANAFVVIDTETENIVTIKNKDEHHAHGMCNPLMAFDGNKVDVIVVEGIGIGALMKLNNLGIKVYKALAPSVRKNVELLNCNQLPEFSMSHTCAGHKRGGCGHF